MIITDKFVFIHVPRTGGTTVEDLFKERHGLKYYHQHDGVRELKESDYDKFIFGFVRNPYAQEFSCWALHTNFGDSDWPQLTFDEWVKLRFDDGYDDMVEKYSVGTKKRKEYVIKCLQYGKTFSINGMYDFFLDDQNICRASKIYKFEELSDSWKEITEIIGMDMTFETWPVSEKYKEYYTDYTYQKVTENRKTDLEMFGYQWGP